jgi:hypothetical protein
MKSDVLTVSEIETRFPSEWVLVGDPVVDRGLNVRKGRVLSHSADRDQVYRKLMELHPKRSAMLFTGRIPNNAAIVL